MTKAQGSSCISELHALLALFGYFLFGYFLKPKFLLGKNFFEVFCFSR